MEIDVKNRNWCFDGIININDFDLDNILLDEQSYENFYL